MDGQGDPMETQKDNFASIVHEGNSLFFKNAPAIRVVISKRKDEGFLCSSSWGIVGHAKTMPEAIRRSQNLLGTWEDAVTETD